jgi:hypothetical protein
MNLINQRLIQCAETCENFIDEFNKKNDPQYRRFLQLAKDCADVCRLAIKIIRNRSGIEYKFLNLVQELCLICAEEGRDLWYDIRFHKVIADCQLCADACKEELDTHSVMDL